MYAVSDFHHIGGATVLPLTAVPLVLFRYRVHRLDGVLLKVQHYPLQKALSSSTRGLNQAQISSNWFNLAGVSKLNIGKSINEQL